MWRHLLIIGGLLSSSAIGWSDVVQFVVDPHDTGILYQGVDVDVFSSDLKGVVLAGQSLSLNLLLRNSVLARLFLGDVHPFGVGLSVYTNARTIPGFAGPTTGFLLDLEGNQLGESQVAGRAAGSDGTFSMGLDSFTSDDLRPGNPLEISGLRLDTTFPATGFVVTNARLRFSLNSSYNSLEFGTAHQLPEPPTLWGLTEIVALVIALLVRSNTKSAMTNRL